MSPFRYQTISYPKTALAQLKLAEWPAPEYPTNQCLTACVSARSPSAGTRVRDTGEKSGAMTFPLYLALSAVPP